MITINKFVANALANENGNIDSSLRGCWKKNKVATACLVVYMIAEIPLYWLKVIVMIICFVPHAIYDALDDLDFLR